ncbi:hypothetical protein EBT31_15340 [bacterium]|nr:hypothetical protein [bacterium]
MLIGLNLKLPRPNLVSGVGGGAGGGPILALGPSLFLDFLAGPTSSLGNYQDASLDLNFVEPQFDIAATADGAYGYGRYLVAG